MSLIILFRRVILSNEINFKYELVKLVTQVMRWVRNQIKTNHEV